MLLGFEYFDATLKSPQRIEAALGVPLLTAFPFTENRHGKKGKRKSWQLELERSRFQNAARALREAVVDSKGHIFLFTSLARDAGTPMVVRWAADALIQAHKRVAIVVFCRTTDDQAYEGIERVTMPALDAGQRTWSDDAIKIDGQPIIAISIGAPGTTALECAGEEAIRAFLRDIARHVDCVIVDTPAVLGNTTGLEIAPLVDHVVIVQPADRAIVPAQERLLRRLRTTSPSLLGVVTTMVREDYLEGIFGEREIAQK